MQGKAQAQRMGTENLLKLIITMSIPGIFGNLSNAAYNIIGRILVGNYVGREALGAIAVIFPLNNITAALSLFITIGGTALVSLTLGKQKYKKANKVFTNIIVQAVVSSAILSVIYYVFANQLVTMCGAEPATHMHSLAAQYLQITAMGQLFQMFNVALASMIRAQGNIKYSMFVSVIGAVLNVFLGYLLVVILPYGLAGAAYATLASQFLAAILSMLFFWQKKSLLTLTSLKFVHIKLIFKIVTMGIAPATLQILSYFSNIMMNKSLRIYGDLELAAGGDLAISALSIIATVESVMVMFIMGINQAVSPIISYNYGAHNYQRVKATTLIAQALAMVFSSLLWAVMMLNPEVLFKIFSSGDTELIEYGIMAMRVSKRFVLFLGFQTLASMYFSAIGRPQIATIISLARQGIFLIPALYIMPKMFGLMGVLYSNPTSDIMALFITGFIYFKEIYRLNRLTKCDTAQVAVASH